MRSGNLSLLLAQGKYFFSGMRLLRGHVDADLRLLCDGPNASEWLLSYPSPLQTGSPINDRAAAFFYQPQTAGPHAVAVILHCLNSRAAVLERWLARAFARRGLAALVPVFPGHMMRRAPGGLRDAMAQGDPEGIRVAVLQGLFDVRRALDWLDHRADIVRGGRGLLGISLGAVQAVMALGLESRFDAGVLVLGGGGLAHSIWASRWAWAPLRRRFERRGITEESLVRCWRDVEPLTFAPRARLKPLYMMNARFDSVVSRQSVERLWEALGRPTIDWLPSGHTTAYLLRHRILARAHAFLTKGLGAVGRQRPAALPLVHTGARIPRHEPLPDFG